MNASDATGPVSRYGPQSVGRGDRITSSPSLRMNTSSVLNWNSLGSRTAWLRLVMKTLAVRAMRHLCGTSMPYTLVYSIRVLNTCLYLGFRADLADREEGKNTLSPLFSTTSSGSNPTLSANTS